MTENFPAEHTHPSSHSWLNVAAVHYRRALQGKDGKTCAHRLRQGATTTMMMVLPSLARSRVSQENRWQSRSREHSCPDTTAAAVDRNPLGLKGQLPTKQKKPNKMREWLRWPKASAPQHHESNRITQGAKCPHAASQHTRSCCRVTQRRVMARSADR